MDEIKSLDTCRVVITLQGEAALRLIMLADQTGMHKNLTARELLIEGMKQKGLLLKSFQYEYKKLK